MIRSLQLVLMGTGPFAVPSFEALRARAKDRIDLVVTKPTSFDSKGMPMPQPVLEWAVEHHLPVFQPKSINDPDAIDRIGQLRPDLLIVCDYGQILSKSALECSRLGGLNLHGSLLPRHRGAAPVQWSILSGDQASGVSVIHMTPKLDGGPILKQSEIPVEPADSALTLESKLSRLGVEALLESIELLKVDLADDEMPVIGIPQEANLVTKAPRLAKSDGQIDPRFPAKLIDRQIRGLQPWPGVYGELQIDGRRSLRISILEASPFELAGDLRRSSEGSEKEPGTLLWGKEFESRSGVPLAMICSQGGLDIRQLQPAGKRAMSAKEFLAGYGKSSSMQFAAPQENHPLLSKLEVQPTHAPN